MRKTFKYRIYTSNRQRKLLNASLGECRWLYNQLLEQRKSSWEEKQKSLTLYDQHGAYRALKERRPSLRKVHSQVLQNVAVRLDLAFKSFFRRVKAGEKPGYPRFRGRFRYNSFTYPQSGWKSNDENGTVRLSKFGSVKIVLHRPIEGKIKTCTVTRTSTDKWFVTFACEWEPTTLPASPEQVGIDLGLRKFATASCGGSVPNPRFFKQEEKNLVKAQRALAREKKGTPGRADRRRVVALIYERIKWRRNDFVHQHSRRVVNKFGLIAVEDLEVNRMVHDKCFSKSISDVAWSQFTSLLSCKAEWAGRKFVKVNPAYTSQTCSSCGHRQPMPLSERTFACPCCGLELDRDHNAAKNILALGQQCLGLEP